MNPKGIRWILLTLAATLPLACSKTEAPPAPASSQTSPVVQASAPSALSSPVASGSARRNERRRPRGGGLLPMMLDATEGMELKDAQKATIDKIEEEMHAEGRSAGSEFKEYRTALVAAVRAGKIDPAALAPLRANLEKGMQARKDKESERLNALHAALEPVQRKALTTAVRAKQAEREAKIAVLRADAGAPDAARPAPADWKKPRIERMTKDFDLDAAQQKSVEALLSKGEHPTPASMDGLREERKKRFEAMLTAFEADTFDAKKLELWPLNAKKMAEGTDKHLQTLTQLLAILKPEQREKLAARMEQSTRGAKAGYPVDDESGFGYFYDEPHHGEPMPPRLH